MHGTIEYRMGCTHLIRRSRLITNFTSLPSSLEHFARCYVVKFKMWGRAFFQCFWTAEILLVPETISNRFEFVVVNKVMFRSIRLIIARSLHILVIIVVQVICASPISPDQMQKECGEISCKRKMNFAFFSRTDSSIVCPTERESQLCIYLVPGHEYCTPTDHICHPCELICSKESNNYDYNRCNADCQGTYMQIRNSIGNWPFGSWWLWLWTCANCCYSFCIYRLFTRPDLPEKRHEDRRRVMDRKIARRCHIGHDSAHAHSALHNLLYEVEAMEVPQKEEQLNHTFGYLQQ